MRRLNVSSACEVPAQAEHLEPSAREFTACMRGCEPDDNCRTDENYACLAPGDILDTNGEAVAQLVDEDGGRFCVSTQPESD